MKILKTLFSISFISVQTVVLMPLYDEDQDNFGNSYYQDTNNEIENGFNDPRRNIYEENEGLFQGDIILSPEQEELVFADPSVNDIHSRTGRLDEKYRWPKNKFGQVIMPYVIQEEDYSNKTRIPK
jgi:hypothetical protein